MGLWQTAIRVKPLLQWSFFHFVTSIADVALLRYMMLLVPVENMLSFSLINLIVSSQQKESLSGAF